MQNWASKCKTLGKLHEFRHGDWENIQEFMTRICDVYSEIEDLEITINKVIMIQLLNTFDTFFVQFPGILSHKAGKKEKLSILESLAQSLEDEKHQMKN